MASARKSIEAADRAVKSTERKRKAASDKNVVTISTGIRFRCKPVSAQLLGEVYLQNPEPTPPIIHDEERGRDEPNANDPDFQAALVQWKRTLGQASVNAMMLGVEVEHIPDGMCGPDADDWLEQLEFVGVDVKRDTSFSRRMSWLRLYALTSPNDLNLVVTAVGKLSTEREGDVSDSMRSFPGREGGGADNRAERRQRRKDGDKIRPARGRPRSRNRGS